MAPVLVAQLDLQIEVAVLVGAELPVADHVDFVEIFAIGQQLNRTSAHAWPQQGRIGIMLVVSRCYACGLAAHADRRETRQAASGDPANTPHVRTE